MKRLMAIVLVMMWMSVAMHAATKKGSGNNLFKETVPVEPWTERALQGFNMRVWLNNCLVMGMQAWNAGTDAQIPVSPHFGLEYPTGSGIEHIFGAGPRIGGVVNGKILVSEAYNGNTADFEFWPKIKTNASGAYINSPRYHFWHTRTGTPIGGDPEGWSGYYYNHGIVTNTRGCDDDHDGKVDEDDLDGIDNDGDWNPATDDVGADGLPDSLEVSCDGQKFDPVLNPDPAQDNYDPSTRDKCHPDPTTGVFPLKNDKDIWTEKNGIPDHGEPHVDEDYGAVSDNDLYCTATDILPSGFLGGHTAMGVQVVQKSYAWKDIDGVLPFEYDFININAKDTIKKVYVGFFADMDVGPSATDPNYPNNNLAGYIDSLRTAYIYNPKDIGSTPLGVTVLKTPKPLDSLTYIFHWFANAGDEPTLPADSAEYSWLSGAAFAPNYIEPNQVQISDTRFFFSFGPFESLAPGDTLRIAIALVGGYSLSAFSSSEPALVQQALSGIKLFATGYNKPVTLTGPSLKITPGFRKVDLVWGPEAGPIDPTQTWDDSNKIVQALPDTSWRRINPPCGGAGVNGCSPHTCTIVDGKPYLPGGRIFQGYRLYRCEDLRSGDITSSPPKTSFTLLRQWDVNENLPVNSNFPTYHTGLATHFTDTNLVRGRKYWYAVTSFGLPNEEILPTIINGKDTNILLYSQNPESPIDESENLQSITIPFSTSDKLGQVLAVPNPYRVDQNYTPNNGGWETSPSGAWTEQDRLLRFIHLPKKCTIRIFDLVGAEIATINFQSPLDKNGVESNIGSYDWPIFSSSHRTLASGVYIFTVESEFGTQVGKFVLIR